MANRQSSLRARIFWLFAAVFLPLVVAGTALVVNEWDRQRAVALASLQDQARSVRQAVEREAALDQAVMSALAASSDIDKADWAAFHQAATQTVSEVRPGGYVYVIDPAAQNIVNTSVPFGAPLPNMRQLLARTTYVEWQGLPIPLPDISLFNAPLQTGKPAFSGLIYGPVSKRPAVAINVPVMRGGKPAYVLGLAYSPEFFVGLLQTGAKAPELIKALTDAQGLIIARNLESEKFVARQAPSPFQNGTNGMPAEGIGESLTLAGVPVFHAYSRSAVNGWVSFVGMPRSAVLAPAWRAMWIWLAVLVSTGLGGAVLAFRLSRQLTRPLTLLARQVHALDEPHGPVPPSGIEEVEALRTALLKAGESERIRRQAERERGQARMELSLANGRLVEADQRKDQFLSLMAHELRNPLAPIRNAVKILGLSPAATSAPLAPLLPMMERQLGHMARLLEDLLDVSRIANGKIELRRQPTDVALAVQAGVESNEPLIESKKHQIALVLPREPLTLVADPARLTQIVSNLVHNAATYSPPGARIEVSAVRETDDMVLCVKDNGNGIAPDELERIFEMFAQAGVPFARSHGGLGIGLALVRTLVGMHGGQIEARSAGLGHGSEFIVRLPLAEDSVAKGPPGRLVMDALP
jgi:signal transduction histidine kinase